MEEISCTGFILHCKGVDSALLEAFSHWLISFLFLWLLLLHVSGNLSQDLPGAMTLVCEILTTDAEGSACRIAYEDFVDLYKYLARVDGRISDDQVHAVLEYLQSDPV